MLRASSFRVGPSAYVARLVTFEQCAVVARSCRLLRLGMSLWVPEEDGRSAGQSSWRSVGALASSVGVHSEDSATSVDLSGTMDEVDVDDGVVYVVE